MYTCSVWLLKTVRDKHFLCSTVIDLTFIYLILNPKTKIFNFGWDRRVQTLGSPYLTINTVPGSPGIVLISQRRLHLFSFIVVKTFPVKRALPIHLRQILQSVSNPQTPKMCVNSKVQLTKLYSQQKLISGFKMVIIK